MAKVKSPSIPLTEIRTPDDEPGIDPILFSPSEEFPYDDEYYSFFPPERLVTLCSSY